MFEKHTVFRLFRYFQTKRWYLAATKRRSNPICKGKLLEKQILEKKSTHTFDIWFMLNHLLFNAAHLKLYSTWKSNSLIAPLLRLVLSKIQFFWNFRWLNRIGIPYVVAIVPFSSNFGTYFPWWFLAVQNFWPLALESAKQWVWKWEFDEKKNHPVNTYIIWSRAPNNLSSNRCCIIYSAHHSIG